MLTDELNLKVSELPFFTIRHEMSKEYPMSKGLWTSSALASGVGNRNIKLFLDIYDRYFEKHEVLIDYLLTDYIFATCCDHCPSVDKMFRQVPENNQNVNELLTILNEPYDEHLVAKTVESTTMNKLSWKYPVADVCEGRRTVYGYFKNLYK